MVSKKGLKWWSVVSVLLLYLKCALCQWNSTIGPTIAVAMIARHGQRTQLRSYRNDPYANHMCSCSLGTLTPKGVRQLYKSGLKKAARYDSLLKSSIQNNCISGPNNIYVRSSSLNRCIVSAESFLDGFLSEFWEKPRVHVPIAKEDTMLTWPGKDCGIYEAKLTEDMSLDCPELVALIEGSDLIRYVAYHSGTEIKNLMDIGLIGDILKTQHDGGLALPAWAIPIYHKYLVPLVDLMYLKYSASGKMQIKSGVLLNDIITRFDRLLYEFGAENAENILYYISHDITLQALIIALDVFDQMNKRPDYGSSISLELRFNDQLQNDVEIVIFYFRSDVDENPLEINIPRCPAPCAYETFKMLIRSKRVVDYDVACNQLCDVLINL